jgi:hypothetical protein
MPEVLTQEEMIRQLLTARSLVRTQSLPPQILI